MEGSIAVLPPFPFRCLAFQTNSIHKSTLSAGALAALEGAKRKCEQKPAAEAAFGPTTLELPHRQRQRAGPKTESGSGTEAKVKIGRCKSLVDDMSNSQLNKATI